MINLPLLQRYTRAIDRLKMDLLALDHMALVSTSDKHHWEQALSAYRKTMRAVQGEYTQFVAVEKDETALNALIKLEYLTYYKNPKAKDLGQGGEYATYRDSLTDLQDQAADLESFFTESLAASAWNATLSYQKQSYLSGWSHQADKNIVYTDGERPEGSPADPTMLFRDFYVLKTTLLGSETGCEPYVPHLYCIATPEQIEVDYDAALATLLAHDLLNSPQEPLKPVKAHFKTLIAHFNELKAKASVDDAIKLTMILEELHDLLNTVASGLPENVKLACDNLQEKALLLEGHPQKTFQWLGALMMALGVLLIALPLALCTLTVATPLIMAGAGLFAAGGALLFFSKQRHTSLIVHDLANAVVKSTEDMNQEDMAMPNEWNAIEFDALPPLMFMQ